MIASSSMSYSISDNTMICVEPGIKAFSEWMSYNHSKYSHTYILVDENTRKCCLPLLWISVPELKRSHVIEIASGENHKHLQTCSYIWEHLGKAGDRKSLLINLGGGVITDMGGFAAATFKRGISFINIPTTLLGMVDASVGGKTGIDFSGLKNEIGVFSHPEQVVIHPRFLETLPERQMLSGYAEMLKHGLIADAGYWKKLSQLHTRQIPCEEWAELIVHSVMVKSAVVSQDPTEQGLRKALNFGHTIGHAIESYSLKYFANKALLHGEAIAVGMVMEAWLSMHVCGLPEASMDEITGYITRHYPIAQFEDEEVLHLMQFDKKNEAGVIQFALISAIGQAAINQQCSAALVKQAFAYYKKQVNAL